MTEAIRTLRDWTARSNRIVFFGGEIGRASCRERV